MDLSAATIKISNTVVTVYQYIENINTIKNKYINKINGYLEDIENTINSALTKSQEWIEMKIKKITKKIYDCIDALLKKINDIINQLRTWYDIQINTIKSNVIMAVFAKLGQDCDKDTAMLFADLIPHPELDSMLPKINIDLELPDVSSLLNIGTVRLPRL